MDSAQALSCVQMLNVNTDRIAPIRKISECARTGSDNRAESENMQASKLAGWKGDPHLKKYENQKFDQKSENLKTDKIWIFRSNAFHGPPKFTEASDWLKNSLYLFRMVIGQFASIWPTFKCVKLLDRNVARFAVESTPPPRLSRRKKKPGFLGLSYFVLCTIHQSKNIKVKHKANPFLHLHNFTWLWSIQGWLGWEHNMSDIIVLI